MSFEFARPFGYPPYCFSVADYVSYQEACDHYDFVIVKIVEHLSCSEQYNIQQLLNLGISNLGGPRTSLMM
jgi:hypothetical protein